MNRKTVTSNVIWRFLERCGAQGVTFVVSIVLARLLDPNVYGVVALVTVFTTFLNVFIDSGLGTSLIQKKDADDVDFSSVFFFNIIVCVLLYVLLFVCAPLIARFYKIPELTPLIRVLGLTLIISGVKNIQQAYVSRHLLFRRFFFATLGGTIGAAIVGILMAIKGYGVWALVAQSLFNMTLDTAILWITVRWRPKKMFSFERLKGLLKYAWKLLAANLLDVAYKDLRTLIIGKIYNTEDLSFYNRGQQFPNLIVTNINIAIDSVLLPTMSSEQDDSKRIQDMTRRAIKTSTYVIMPIMVGLAVCAEPLIRVLLTEKWMPCVFYLRIFCITLAFYPIHTANLNAIKAMGRSDIFLKLEIIKKIVGLVALVSTMYVSVKAMAYSMLATSIASQLINSFPNRKLMGYSYISQIKDILPQIGLSCLMGAITYCVQFLQFSDILTLLIQVPVGVIVYISLSIVFRIDSFNYVLAIGKQLLKIE